MFYKPLAFTALALGGLSTPAMASEPAPMLKAEGVAMMPPPADSPRLVSRLVSDTELDQQRGGFRFAGLDIRLGADIKTFLNGELALHTTIQWTDSGLSQTQTVAGGLTLADADTLRNNVLANGAITMNIGAGDRVYLANEGQTALIHGNDGALQNVLINTASNITATQEVTATLDLGGYQQFAAAITSDQLGRNLGEDVTRAVTGAFGM